MVHFSVVADVLVKNRLSDVLLSDPVVGALVPARDDGPELEVLRQLPHQVALEVSLWVDVGPELEDLEVFL